jgi:hypothetical protein
VLVGSAGLLAMPPCVRREEKLFPNRCILRRNLFMRLAYPPTAVVNRPGVVAG